MRVFYRTAPVFMALSVALAGCSESDPPAAKYSAGGVAKAGTAATVDPSSSTEVCLTVEGMH